MLKLHITSKEADIVQQKKLARDRKAGRELPPAPHKKACYPSQWNVTPQ